MHWLKTHRLLLVVYGSGIALAIAEMGLPESRTGELEGPETFLTPDINIADVSSALYPERSLSLYYRAYQASLCYGPAATMPKECLRRDPVEPGEVRELIERSLATGNRSIELAMYNYAMVLIQENAPAKEIDAAIRTWRIAYPGSSRPDPRAKQREMKRPR
jgi:hypothetical protein